MAARLMTVASLLLALSLLQLPQLIFAHEARMSVRAHHSHHTHHSHHNLKIPKVEEEEDVFASNHLVPFSWYDPKLQKQLWEGHPMSSAGRLSARSTLEKRAGIRKIIPKVRRSLHCLGCLKKAAGSAMTIDQLSTQWLQDHIIPTEKQMKDKCVFYTGVKNTDRVGVPWLSDTSINLSPRASRWACENNLYSLWTLYPGKDANVSPNPPANGVVRRNFWEIATPGSWINHLYQTPQQFTYFENMSRAMANMCSGKVFVMSIDPEHTATYGTDTNTANNNMHSIWNRVEVVALRAQGKTTELIGIAADTFTPYKLRLNDLVSEGVYTGPIPRAITDMRDKLMKRDTCTNNRLYEPPGEDWFGTGRRTWSR